jgi:hypothetical protein
LSGVTFLQNNIQIINGSLRLSADQRVVNDETILTGSRVFNAIGDWDGGIIEMRAKFPNGHCLKSHVWLGPKYSDWKVRGPENIDFVSFQEFNPNLIRSGLWKKTSGKQLEFSGIESSMTYDFTNVFNVFTKDYIYWKLNGQIYRRELINRYSELESGTNHNKIREPFYGKYTIFFQLVCDPINDRRVDKNCWNNPYLFIDYIKIYNSSDSETDESIQN